MYLLGRAGGYAAQEALWKLRSTGRLALHNHSDAECDRLAALMDKYSDTPMDLADASVVAAAGHFGMKRLFTLDSHFHIYRLADGNAFEIIP